MNDLKIRNATAKGYVSVHRGGVFDNQHPNSKTRRGRVQDNGETCPTIQTSNEILRYENDMRIRKLTERECFRLMGVSDKDIDTIQATGIAMTKQYQLAGNSIVVNVLDAIFEQMFFPQNDDDLLF